MPATRNKKSENTQKENQLAKARRLKETTTHAKNEIFEQCAKLVALQNSKEFIANRSFIQIDLEAIPQSEQTVAYDIDSDTNTPYIERFQCIRDNVTRQSTNWP